MTWVTAYCFTEGIIRVQVQKRGKVYTMRLPGARYDSFIHSSEVHETRESAVEFAHKKRAARIEALERQIARLKALEF